MLPTGEATAYLFALFPNTSRVLLAAPGRTKAYGGLMTASRRPCLPHRVALGPLLRHFLLPSVAKTSAPFGKMLSIALVKKRVSIAYCVTMPTFE